MVSKMKIKVIVAGSRTIQDYGLVKYCIDTLQTEHSIEVTEIVSGTATGVDTLGERWAQENNVPIKRFPADWNRYGKSAGYRRNEEMARYANALLAIWDGESRGTKHMINLAEEQNLQVFVSDLSEVGGLKWKI